MLPHWRARLLRLGLALGGVLLAAAPGAAGILDVSWTAPTTSADGSPLTNLASYRVYYGTSDAPCRGPSFFQVASATPSPADNETVTFRLSGLLPGPLYYVSVTAVDTNGHESACADPLGSAVARLEFAVSRTGILNFGTVNLGSFADQTLTVSNTGDGAVLGIALTSTPFSIASPSWFYLTETGATQPVTIRFTPTTSATATANITIITGAGDILSQALIGSGTDTTPPAIAITAPTSHSTYSTSDPLLTLDGTTSDNVGVAQVTWANSQGGSGTAGGTTSWRASGIVLEPGANVLTVTAQDAAGNTATASVTITFTPTSP